MKDAVTLLRAEGASGATSEAKSGATIKSFFSYLCCGAHRVGSLRKLEKCLIAAHSHHNGGVAQEDSIHLVTRLAVRLEIVPEGR